MTKLDIVALVTAVGAVVTAILNYMHGRDDSNNMQFMVKEIETQAKHTASVTKELNTAFRENREMLKDLIVALSARKDI